MTPQRTTKEYLLLFSKGAGMGAADVMPGVSGGTIAYPKRIGSCFYPGPLPSAR